MKIIASASPCNRLGTPEDWRSCPDPTAAGYLVRSCQSMVP